MYKCKTISMLHLPKTGFATAGHSRKSKPNTQGVSFTFVQVISMVSSVVAQTNYSTYIHQINKAPCLPSLYFSSTVTV